MNKKANILLIYTGGTIGMIEGARSRSWRPFDFDHITTQVPELQKLDVEITVKQFDHPIDSSDMSIEHWTMLVGMIREDYDVYDGFVVLHGTDTMAFTAAALSFMLENLDKPVILTGSQLPIGVLRTDGKENMITAIEIAGTRDEKGRPVVQEVAVYFEYKLYRGNRVHKIKTSHFRAFDSPNYPVLAEAGIDIMFNRHALKSFCNGPFGTGKMSNPGIDVLPLFPGLCQNQVKRALLESEIEYIVLLTYGIGNAPTYPWFIDTLKRSVDQGRVILNITQCMWGRVDMTKYESGHRLMETGVLSGCDITMEAALSKMMYLHAKGLPKDEFKQKLTTSLRGEMSC